MNKHWKTRLQFLCVLFSFVACAPKKVTPVTKPLTTTTAPTKARKVPNCSLGGCQSLPIPEDLQAQVESAEMIGFELFRIDYAAALATDIALEKGALQSAKNLGGYLPLREIKDGKASNSVLVSFFTAEESPHILFQVRVFLEKEHAPEWISFDSPKLAPDAMVPLIKARQNAIISVLDGIAQPINPIVLPFDDLLVVYLLAGSKTSNLAILGQHYRLLFSEDGETIRDAVSMSKNVHGFVTNNDGKTLLQVEPVAKDALEMPYDDDTAVLTVTHIVTDWPMESHVFANLLYGVPIYVITGRGIWLVEGGHISYLTDQVPGKEEEPLPTMD